MPTIIEHYDQHDDGISSAVTAVFAFFAIILVGGFAMYVLQFYPFSERSLTDTAAVPPVNVTLNGALPGSNQLMQ